MKKAKTKKPKVTKNSLSNYARGKITNEAAQHSDEQSASGHMPNPEAIKDVDTITDKVGLYTKDKPQALNVAKQVEKAEKRNQSNSQKNKLKSK